MDLFEFFMLSVIIYVWLMVFIIILVGYKLSKLLTEVNQVILRAKRIPVNLNILKGQMQVLAFEAVLNLFKRGGDTNAKR